MTIGGHGGNGERTKSWAGGVSSLPDVFDGADAGPLVEVRVLLLVDAACRAPGSRGVLNGLAKLAAMDFLVCNPALMPAVIEKEHQQDTRLHLDERETGGMTLADLTTRCPQVLPEQHYKHALGGIVGRGSVSCTKHRSAGIVFKTTEPGRELARELASHEAWHIEADRCAAVADMTVRLSGKRLKKLIDERLPPLTMTIER